MKLKLLLLFIGIANLIWAQEPYRNLVITEARLIQGDGPDNYIEVTNMGDSDIDLRDIKFCQGRGPIYDVWNDTWQSWRGWEFVIPEEAQKILKPGESYVITEAYDFYPRMNKMRIVGYEGTDRVKQTGIYQYADFLIHMNEKNSLQLTLYPDVKDSVTVSNEYIENGGNLMTRLQDVNNGLFIQQYFGEGDSAAIDQVRNCFEDNGNNDNIPDAVAGVANATATALLVRKSIIKQGNLDFEGARGVGLDDSEWMAVEYPAGADNYRDTWWSVGNHGDFVLDANTFQSDVIDVDFAAKTLTVPWGIRRLDDIMRNMKYTPGVAWIYHLNDSSTDSLYRSAQSGDKLTVYVFGETLYNATFDIIVKDPDPGSNIVVPVDHKNLDGGPITNNTQNGILDWPRVTNHKNGPDTITGLGYGIQYAMRTDTLMKYLEKPSNAEWEFVFVDGKKRADLKSGDKLRVIAQNGDVKDYFIEIRSYSTNHNANLASITWPDISIPEFYQEIEGWKGDTIPNFDPFTTNYRVRLPFDYVGIPALVAKTEDLNASIKVTRATTLDGTVEDRTVTFEVTAEDDSVKNIYNVELVKEENPNNIQPYHAEPFLSEHILSLGSGNTYAEICNPGNQPLDLSNYMICSTNNATPADAIKYFSGSGDWLNRYRKYIPGYKYVSKIDWSVEPGILETDLNVNTIVMPGDVFCLGAIKGDRHVMEDMDWRIPKELDVQFSDSVVGVHDLYNNPWNEEVAAQPIAQGFRESFFIFKILNDSIKRGLKPPSDPNDFDLIEAFGMADGDRWFIGGNMARLQQDIKRKPEINKANPQLQGSFGTNLDDTEWILLNRPYLQSLGYGEPELFYIMESDLGKHFFNEPTQYMSTISAVVYKVSPGYSLNENIKGVLTGTTAAAFIGNIFKANEGQTLALKSYIDGSELAMEALLSNNDTLVVLSADSVNTTKYVLEVNNEGLSSNAVLTSNRYKVTIEQQPKSASEANAEAGVGNIKGFDYGTALRTILANITVPPGASLTVTDGQGAYVPLKMLNFDTTYVNVTVNANIYFDVVAENGVTEIIYQLIPEVSDNDAFVTSDVYNVVQKDVLINYVPRGTNVQAFLGNLIASAGATMKLVDKLGNERTVGSIVQDDKVVVTSPNNLNTKVYYISMLATQYVPETTYLAYIQSVVYGIDQVQYKVYGVSGTETITDFLSKIKASQGATAVIVDDKGIVKTSGDINNSDMVMVTSADGKLKVYYTFGQLTGIENAQFNQIQLYPNPTDSKINIQGLNPGSRIQVYNAVGVVVRDVFSQKQNAIISLDGEASGLYLIVISDKNVLLGRYKAVKK